MEWGQLTVVSDRRADCWEQMWAGREICQKTENSVLIASTSHRSRKQGHQRERGEGRGMTLEETRECVHNAGKKGARGPGSIEATLKFRHELQ